MKVFFQENHQFISLNKQHKKVMKKDLLSSSLYSTDCDRKVIRNRKNEMRNRLNKEEEKRGRR